MCVCVCDILTRIHSQCLYASDSVSCGGTHPDLLSAFRLLCNQLEVARDLAALEAKQQEQVRVR